MAAVNEPAATPVDWRIFLTDSPPGLRASVDGAATNVLNNGWPEILLPELQLHCDGSCQGPSFCSGRIRASGLLFAVRRDVPPRPGGSSIEERYDLLLCYTCGKCLREVKSYAVRFCQRADPPVPGGVWGVEKMGEWPRFSPRTPSKLMSIVGPDRELYLQGRRAEIDGIGVGAFSYYRRIVEGQKNRLLDEIIRVAKRTRVPNDMIARPEAAKGETQFSKAVGEVREAFPPALFIKGHNPSPSCTPP